MSHLDSFMERMAATMNDEEFARAFSPEGLARTADWQAEDDWIVSYTTSRIRAGTMHGLFAVFLYEPQREKGKTVAWKRVKVERCDTRREAKARAIRHYAEHSPKWAESHGIEVGG